MKQIEQILARIERLERRLDGERVWYADEYPEEFEAEDEL